MADDQGCPMHGAGTPPLSRRALLRRGGAAAVVALGTAALAGCSADRDVSGPPAPPPASTTAPSLAPEDRAVPFHGPHQAGITTLAPAAAIVAALDCVAGNRAELARTFATLTERIRFLTAGGVPLQREGGMPPADSGILGPTVPPGNLTVTVAVGASLFDGRYGLSALRPRELEQMPRFRNDVLDPEQSNGDLLLQVCADQPDTCLHALRDITAHTRGTLILRWMQEGFNRPNAVVNAGKTGKTTTRNLLGFKDGSANPDPEDERLMDDLVWIRPGDGEPAWTVGGTYQVVRIIRMFVERWDRTALSEQEHIIGRHKASGAPLGASREEDPIDYSADPTGAAVPLNAHIRMANPRTPQAMATRILRRGFAYSRGFDAAGQLNQGLLFVSFQKSIARGFAAIQGRLDGEPLEEYIRPVGGGYFFALPGVPTEQAAFAAGLFQA